MKIKSLEEQIIQDKKINEEKHLESTNLFEQKTELEKKVEKLTREIKMKDKEVIQINQMENHKIQKITLENEEDLKEKDKKIGNLEKAIELLNQQITQKNHELSVKNAEYNKEITRLTIDLEKFKSKGTKNNNLKNKNNGDPDMNIKSFMKTIQTNFTEFKESLDSLEREKENLVSNICKTIFIISSNRNS